MFLIDTDIASYAIKSQHGMASKLLDLNADDWAISAITHHEISFGISLDDVSSRIKIAGQAFLQASKVLSFDNLASQEAAMVRKQLRILGKPSGHFDSLIAGHAIAIGATLVTNNTRHFENVSGLKIENWL